MKTSTTYYTIKDYLGNIRKVMKSDRTIVQTQNYYPFGSLLNDNVNSNNIQTHKYNGKELDRMHGLDLYEPKWWMPIRKADIFLKDFLNIYQNCQ